MKKDRVAPHVFALFIENLSLLLTDHDVEKPLIIKDKDLWARLVRILRLKANEPFVLFDGIRHATCVLQPETFDQRRSVYVLVRSVEITRPLSPAITLCCGMVKKDFFEQVAYYAAQMGATSLQPLITVQIQCKWGGEKERERLARIMIAACEQSKNFFLPVLEDPCSLSEFLNKESTRGNAVKIFFEATGSHLHSALPLLVQPRYDAITLLVGPEGGLVSDEQELLRNNGFISISLTPTILRSVEAVAVGLGIVRSIVRPEEGEAP